MKILTIVGARPQFVKAAVVSRAIRDFDDITECIVHTGQHFDANMSEIFFTQMGIPEPNYNLEIGSLSHGAMTGRMLEKIEATCIKEKPDRLLVYGDTNSTLAGSLAASKLHIPVAHVEAGLRSFNMDMPEEINRILTDRVSDLLLCPSDVAVQNLKNEGYSNFDARVENVGDVMQDAAMHYSSRATRPHNVTLSEGFALVSVHRAENTDDPIRLENIVNALNAIHCDIPVIFPIHPRTRKILEQRGLDLDVNVIDPVGYLEIIWLLKHAAIVLTDSGGMQKEAFFFGKPCVTLRDETEWTELIEKQVNLLAGADYQSILDGVSTMMSRKIEDDGVYGNGKAGGRIAGILSESS